MTEIVKGRKLHFLSGRDKNGSLVSISSVLANANEIIKIAPAGLNDFNTELVVKFDQYPNQKKLPTNVLESERHRLRTIVYNRLDLEKILAIEFQQDESSAFTMEFSEELTHPLSMSQLGTLLSHWYGYDIIDADATLTHIRDNQYTITAKPDSLGYIGIATINAGGFVIVEPTEPEEPVEGTPTESFFFTINEEVAELNVNGVMVPVNELYQRYGVSLSIWTKEIDTVFGLVNTSANTLQIELPGAAGVPEYNINESLVEQEDGTRTVKLSPMLGIVEQPSTAEEVLDSTEFTFGINVTDSNALGKLVECWIDGEKITFAASFENDKVSISRDDEGNLSLSNLNTEVTSVVLVVKTASLGNGEGIYFGDGVTVEVVGGYEVISFNLAAVEVPVEEPSSSNITLGKIQNSTAYTTLLTASSEELVAILVTIDELTSSEITVEGQGTGNESLTLNIKPETTKNLVLVPFNIAAADWAKISTLAADTVIGELTVIEGEESNSALLTAGTLATIGVSNPDEDSYTFAISVTVSFTGTLVFNLDFDTANNNRYRPTTTTFDITVLNYIESWVAPAVLVDEELRQFYKVDEDVFENETSVTNWLATTGEVTGLDLFRDATVTYQDRHEELPTSPLFFNVSDEAKNYITSRTVSSEALFTISVDGVDTSVSVGDIELVSVQVDDVEKHYFKLDVSADQIKNLKVVKITGDLDGEFGREGKVGGMFKDVTHTFNYTVTIQPAPSIPSPIAVAPATEELVNFVIDRMNNEGEDVTHQVQFGHYEETVEQDGNRWTVTQLLPYSPDTKQVAVFITFPKEVLDKLTAIPEDAVVFRGISDTPGLAEALTFTAIDVISMMFELNDAVYLPLNQFVGSDINTGEMVWGVDFDGEENFYTESSFIVNVLGEMEPAPSASIVNLVDIEGTDIEHQYILTDYSTLNGKDTLQYRTNQLGSGLEVHVPFSIPAEARSLLGTSTTPAETRITAKVNGNVVQTYTVEQISNWSSLVPDTANSHFTYTVPESEAVHQNQDVTYNVTFEADFDGTGRVYSQHNSEHTVVVSYVYDSERCPVLPVVITDKALYDQIKAKNSEMSTLDFEEFIKHEVTVNGLDVKIHVKEEVEYFHIPLFYKADSTFAYANTYPTVDTIIAQIDSRPLTAGDALTKVVQVDDDYYFVKMIPIGTSGTFRVIADWDGEDYSYCRQTTTDIPYTVYKYQMSLYGLPSVPVEQAIHASHPTNIQPYEITSEDASNVLTRNFVVNSADKGKTITLVYKVPETLSTYLATLPADTEVLRFSNNDSGELLNGSATADKLVKDIRVEDGEHYLFFSVSTTNIATTLDVQMNVDWDGGGFVYREDSYRLINNFDWVTPIVSELLPVEPGSVDYENVLGAKLENGYNAPLHVEFEIDHVGNITRHDILDATDEAEQKIYHVFAVPPASKPVLEAAADDELVITIDGTGYSKATIGDRFQVFEDNIYLVLEHTPERTEVITQHVLTVSQDWDGSAPYYSEGTTVLTHSAEFFTQSSSIMEPVTGDVAAIVDDLHALTIKVSAGGGVVIPEVVSYTGTETVLKHVFNTYGDPALYVVPMIIPTETFAAIQAVAERGDENNVMYIEELSAELTAANVINSVVTINDVHYFPFPARVSSKNDEDNVTETNFYFDADALGIEYGETLNKVTISFIHELPLLEPKVEITQFGRSMVLEGTYTPGYILEVHATEDGVEAELMLSKKEDKGTWEAIDYSQRDDIEYVIEAKLYDPADMTLVAEDSITAKNVIEEDDEVSSNEVHFTTLAGSVDYVGTQGDQIFLSDDTIVEVTSTDETITFDVPAGKHKVKLVESVDRSSFVSVGGEALVELHNFPTLSTITKFNFSTHEYNDAPNLTKVPEYLPSNIIDLEDLFYTAVNFNQDVSMWDVSNVKIFDYAFSETQLFNQPLNSWNVSSVTSMHSMFRGAISFNQPLNNWDISNVTNMYSVFWDATAFNQPLNNWNVSNVTDMGSMFYRAEAFNGDVSGWDTSKVTDMSSMFSNATSFNQPIGGWDVSNVTNMGSMFSNAVAFNQDISGWDVSNVTSMAEMFRNATSFNQDLSSWCVALITTMPTIFDGSASAWTLPRPVWGTCPRGETPSTFINLRYDDLELVPLHGEFFPEDADEIVLYYNNGDSVETIVVEMNNEAMTYTAPTFVRDINRAYDLNIELKRDGELLAENSHFIPAIVQ